jgi:hypothetical protein
MHGQAHRHEEDAIEDQTHRNQYGRSVQARIAATHTAEFCLLQRVLKMTETLHADSPSFIVNEQQLILAMHRAMFDDHGAFGNVAYEVRRQIQQEHNIRPFSTSVIVKYARRFLMRYLAEVTKREPTSFIPQEPEDRSEHRLRQERRSLNPGWRNDGNSDITRIESPKNYR